MRKEADITKAQPDMGEVHVDAPMGNRKKKKVMNAYGIEIEIDDEEDEMEDEEVEMGMGGYGYKMPMKDKKTS